MGYQLGIDLGTMYTAAAIGRDGRVEITSLGAVNTVIPSVVLLRADGEVLTGEAAVRRGLAEPTRVAREFKRRLGDPTPLVLGGTPYTPESLMGHLLRDVVRLVTGREGSPPDRVVLTHPAAYGPYKLEQMHEVARLGGLDPATTAFLTEPQAAAISYAARSRVDLGDVVAVYDFGGGTFDVAIVQRSASGFAILGRPEGLERFGGIDVDAAILAFVDQSLDGALSRLDPADPAVQADVARLREDCRVAKESLSADTDTSIRVSVGGATTEVRLRRSELEGMVRPRLVETIEALERAVRSAGLTMDQVSRILLVGGSSRMPIVGALLAERTGRPIAGDAHPKFAIATGAAGLGRQPLAAQGRAPALPPPAATPGLAPPPPPPLDAPGARPPFVAPTPTALASRRRTTWIVAAAAVVALVVGGLVVRQVTSGSDAAPSSTRPGTTPGLVTSVPGGATVPSSASGSATTLGSTTSAAVTTTAPPTTAAPATSPPATAAPSTAPPTTDPKVLQLTSGISLRLPDGYQRTSTTGIPVISNGTVSLAVQVLKRPPGEPTLSLLQAYVDTFDGTYGAVAYTQTIALPPESGAAAASDGSQLGYFALDADGTGYRGLVTADRRADGLAVVTDEYRAFGDLSGQTLPDGVLEQLHQSFLAAPLLGPVVDLAAASVGRVSTKHTPLVIDGLVAITAPAGWSVDAPGPGRVVVSRADGQRFLAAKVPTPLAGLDAAKATATADTSALVPDAQFGTFTDTPIGTFQSTRTDWRGTDPGTGQALTGTIEMIVNPSTGEAFETLQAWVGVAAEPPSKPESQFLRGALLASITEPRT